MSQFVRKSTIKCVFDKDTRQYRATPIEIHTWIQSVFKVTPDQITAIQLDNEAYCVYIKFVSPTLFETVLRKTPNTVPFKHSNGEISQVSIENASEVVTKVRVFNLPIEMELNDISHVLSDYGQIKSVENEKWSQHFMYPVENGVRCAMIILSRNIPSRVMFKGFRGSVSYQGQVPTCFYCLSEFHLANQCAKRTAKMQRKNQGESLDVNTLTHPPSPSSYTSVVVSTPPRFSLQQPHSLSSIAEKMTVLGHIGSMTEKHTPHDSVLESETKEQEKEIVPSSEQIQQQDLPSPFR